MPMSNWPKHDKPREKLLEKGEKALTPAELIAIFLRTGTNGKTALDVAHAVLNEFGNLKQLSHASTNALLKIPGIGHAKLAALKAAFELGRRMSEETIEIGTTLNSSMKTKTFLTHQLQHYSREVFGCIFLDIHCRYICFEELFYGTLHEASIYPREIVSRALGHHAANIILAHNHPSGIAFPSQADRAITKHLQEALRLIDVTVLDHVIIGNPDYFSFAEAGLI